MGDIKINGFSGASNVNDRFLSNVSGRIAEPKVILNADVDLSKKLTIRKGKTLFWTLPGAHSLWAGVSCMLCVAEGVLYRNIGGVAVNVGTVSGPKHPFSYVEAEDKVYISNPHWQGVFNPADNSISSWGVAVPPGPMLLTGIGNLPAGTYHVCMTNVSGGELSGNSSIASITLDAEGGIQVLNRPANALVWATDADEYMFYLVGAVDMVVDIPTVEPLPSFLCSPPPYLENLCYAFGRIWGSSGDNVYYSEPFKLGWFKLASNRFSFESPVTMIAKVSTGLFIGMEDKTRFLAGTEPDQMTESDAGAGSVMGTLAYCNNLPDLSSTLGTPEKGFVDVPVWLTTEGWVAGNTAGKLYNLTKNKIKTSIPLRGASLYRNLDGVFQFLTSFKSGTSGSGAGAIDEDTYNAFKNGCVDTYSKRNLPMGSSAGFTDSATCRVFRDGVEI
jgi:hypothetical protein